MRTAMVRLVLVAVLAGVAVAATAGPARAGISFVNMFRNDSYTQTGNGSSLSSNGLFLSLGLFSTNPGDYSSVTATFPGPVSPVGLTPVAPDTFAYQTGLYPDQAALDAAFPFGTYTFTATGGAVDVATFDYTADAYPAAAPYLTGTNYADLQGMNPAADFAFTFSPFAPDPAASAAYRFFTVFDYTTNAFVYVAGFLPTGTAGLVLPANTLVAGHLYGYELIDSDRVFVPSPGAVFDAQLGFDRRTGGLFTPAAVPEPASLLLAATAGGCWLRRRRAATV